MDKIAKALAKLSEKERKKIKQALEKLSRLRPRRVGASDGMSHEAPFSKEVEGLDVKKLKDRNDIFRLRVGDLRVIYRLNEGKIFILAISRRNEKTYR